MKATLFTKKTIYYNVRSKHIKRRQIIINHQKILRYLFVLLSISYITFQVYQLSNFQTAMIVLMYTALFSAVLCYFFLVKENQSIFEIIFSIGLGYLWVFITWLILDDVIYIIGALGGVTLGIIICLVYRLNKKQES